MESIINYSLAWLFVFAILGTAWIAKIVAGHWLNPGSMYGLFWTAMCAIPLVIAFGNPINPIAIAYIAITSLAITCSMFPFDWKKTFKMNTGKPNAEKAFGTTTLYFSALAFSALAILSTISKVIGAGFSITELLTSTLATAGAFAASRYEGELESTLFGKIGLLSAYLAVFTGALFAGSTTNSVRRRIAVFAAFLPAVLTATLQSAKGLLFLSLAFFYGGILVSRIYNKDYTLASKKDLRTLLIGVLLFMPVVVASFLARGLTSVTDTNLILDRLTAYAVSYSSGHLYAFADWFSSIFGGNYSLRYREADATPGFYTTLFAFRLFGDTTQLPAGIYDEYFASGPYLQSNIYTVFRGLITDFGIIGSIAFVYLIGTASCLVFRGMLISKNSSIAISLFLLMTGAIYMSYIVSILTWSVIPASIVACTAILKINSSKIGLA